jgi:hypothetical protein
MLFRSEWYQASCKFIDYEERQNPTIQLQRRVMLGIKQLCHQQSTIQTISSIPDGVELFRALELD